MAHLGFRSSVVFVALSIGCGGKVDALAPASASDTGVSPDVIEDDTPLPSGFESYTATVTEVTATWMYGGGSGAGQPSQGKSFRVDVDPRGGGVVAMTEFGRAIALGGFPGTMKASDGASFFGASGTVTYEYVNDSYDSLEITLGADGRPVSGIAHGRSERFSGDVGYEGTLVAKLAFVRDTKKPYFKATAGTSFGSVPLPWDERVVEANEPYEETFGAAALLGDVSKRATTSDIVEEGWGAKRMRGARFQLTSWDAAASIAIIPSAVRDLAGNGSERTTLKFDGAIDVPLHGSSAFAFESDAFARWGEAKVVTVGCKSSKRCLQIGPVLWSYCSQGSAGGAAIRLPSSGTVTAMVRGEAKPAPMYPGYPSDGPPNMFPQLQIAAPGGDAKYAETSGVKWTSASSDGSWDTGWTELSATLPGDRKESGVAIGGGGRGAYSSGCSAYGGPPVPLQYNVTFYVDGIAIE